MYFYFEIIKEILSKTIEKLKKYIYIKNSQKTVKKGTKLEKYLKKDFN